MISSVFKTVTAWPGICVKLCSQVLSCCREVRQVWNNGWTFSGGENLQPPFFSRQLLPRVRTQQLSWTIFEEEAKEGDLDRGHARGRRGGKRKSRGLSQGDLIQV